ncbi:MAG: NAD-dependent epimerase/dehydratase family protein [Candidatus Eisenbacteria bacterium]|uniref:NAD-dependent epimerase/dehydratase family protein n=1 Tax=Eiseniibacteriota bacterium TaxID=2212470 RepID=A0A948RWE8_UNCEI|nr:NAD-dependent epimerase/dehydratase family protein [Candidatus Eisenbacteria bacterium]MBU1949139.1 NAD-dependent epimerase/dehydratase family protein [Candidatus Eisenbacteria bacterium]MBU2690793.1 NAD-dependent epimerase/dehydratase family protein [Candidatus Eisenbacteria bacterium]
MMNPVDRLDGWEALVLGGTGLIGAHAVRSLSRRGVKVRVLIRSSHTRRDVLDDVPGVRFIRGDLFSLSSLESAMEGCHLFVHAAGPYPVSARNRDHEIQRAHQSMTNILDAMRRNVAGEVRSAPLNTESIPDGLVRAVYVSSSTTIAPPGNGEPLQRMANEDNLYEEPPKGPSYFAVKEAMERKARDAARGEGLPIVIVNPSLVIGPYDTKPTTGQLVVSVARNRMPFLLHGNINVVTAKDVGEGIVLAALRGEPGHRYILGSENMTMDDLVRRIAMATGARPPKLHLPVVLAKIFSYLTEGLSVLTPGRPPLFPLNGLHMLLKSQYLDASRAREELGWNPSSVDLAITQAVAFLRKEGRIWS